MSKPQRECVACPSPNPDCEHPTCPRWPQPGHYYAAAVEIVRADGPLDLEWRIAAALADAYGRGRDDEAAGEPLP